MHSRASAGLSEPLYGTGRAAKSRMAEPTNIFRGKNKEYLCLQWAELLKAVMAECIYLFIGGTYLIFNWRKLCKSLLMEEEESHIL